MAQAAALAARRREEVPIYSKWQHGYHRRRTATDRRRLPSELGSFLTQSSSPPLNLKQGCGTPLGFKETPRARKEVSPPVAHALRAEKDMLIQELSEVEKAIKFASQTRRSSAEQQEKLRESMRSKMLSSTEDAGIRSDAVAPLLAAADAVLAECASDVVACESLSNEKKTHSDALRNEQEEVWNLASNRKDIARRAALQENKIAEQKLRCNDVLSEVKVAQLAAIGEGLPAPLLAWATLAENAVKNAALHDALRAAGRSSAWHCLASKRGLRCIATD
eukprot:TRINITY_DN63001_c0_g1_i1.p1 TRINITY_DN63001_c0_g1~~TRINITY_DN63001_c0_g1_i1.p1  ORF type:complete len:278 (-),score=61.62 TRINITY_DN63001_c0_g1_i1:82-915(-)